ncbi:uncharacterized protein LOC134770534 [Penaeus indicus]|uniref:uncharacterized protein LOC134770534 n=1 Tax=Penaeus indicus TaxID=29960 RepID=UPI00300C8D79
MFSEAILCEERTASHVISSWVVPTFATMLGKYLLVVSLTCCSAGAAADEAESPGFAPIRFIDNQSGDLIHAHRSTKADVASVSNTKDLLYGPYKLFTDLGSGGWPDQPGGGNATTASAASAAEEGARRRHDRKHRSGSSGGRRRDGNWHRKQRRKKERQEASGLAAAEGGRGKWGRNWQPKNRFFNRTRKFNNGRLNKKNLKNDWKRRHGNRHNNRRQGWPAGIQYRSVNTQQPKVQKHIVRLHNLLRAKVTPTAADMLAMAWYDTAAEQAQAWAEQCGADSEADHPSVRWTSRYGACGQNVMVSPRKRHWSFVMHNWWSGRRSFTYGGESNNSSAVSAYTQMAWYNSHQVGCGFAECSEPGGKTFFRYVCNYCPSGNDPRRLSRPYTQGRSCRKCPDACRSVCRKPECKLCTNACAYSDLWVNCKALDLQWHEWLCNTKTRHGVERFRNCRATCQCLKRIT